MIQASGEVTDCFVVNVPSQATDDELKNRLLGFCKAIEERRYQSGMQALEVTETFGPPSLH